MPDVHGAAAGTLTVRRRSPTAALAGPTPKATRAIESAALGARSLRARSTVIVISSSLSIVFLGGGRRDVGRPRVPEQAITIGVVDVLSSPDPQRDPIARRRTRRTELRRGQAETGVGPYDLSLSD